MSLFKTLRNISSYLAVGSSVFVFLTSAALVGININSAASAWKIDHTEKVYCDSEHTIAFDWSFKNTEPNDPKFNMDLLVTEVHTGQTAQKSVAPGETVSGSFDTDFTRVGSWRIRYEMTWTNGMAGTQQAGDIHGAFECEQPPKYIDVCRDGKVISINVQDRRSTDTDPPCPVEYEYGCRDGGVGKIVKGTRKSSDTDAPCPVTEYEFVCRDGEVVKIVKGERQDGDTDAPCPLPEYEYVCRDGKVIKINVEDRKSTDTDAPCPITQYEYVCRDGNVIKIVKGTRANGDTDAPCPVVLGTATPPSVSKELPNTGSETLITATLAGFLSLGMVAHYSAKHLYLRQFS